MKRNLLTFVFLFLLTSGYAQSFLGLRASQYGGITNVAFNPAIAGDRHRFDMTFIGLGATVSNSYIGVDPKTFLKKNYINDNLDFQETYLREKINGKSKSALIDMQLQGPLSFMFTFGKKKENHKNAIALSWNFNSVTNVNGLSEKLARILYWGVGYRADSLVNFDYQRLSQGRFSARTLNWIDYGITYSREVYNQDAHYLKVGGTLKFIQGIFAVNAMLDNFDYRWQNYDTLSIYNSSGNLDVNAFAPTSKEYFDKDRGDNIGSYIQDAFKLQDGGFSAAGDVAVVYEWRPQKDKYKYQMDGREWYDVGKSLYTIQAGFSMNDLGRLRFKRSEYSYRFNVDKQDWYVADFNMQDGLQSFGDTIRVVPGFDLLPVKSSFTMWLPTRFNFWIDYNPVHFFGVHAMATIAPQMNPETSVRRVTTFAVTPHLDWTYFGLYLPLSYDIAGNFNFGSTIRIGPLIVGTNDLLALMGGKKYMRNADIHVALKIPILARKHRDRDKDFVSNKYDECRKEKGTWETRGCPDRDGDGIADSEDKCPDAAGPKETKGCPDRDGDGILDMDDECPDEKGLAEFNGCPDRDGDGVPDKDDDCPDEKGLVALKGCPDSDGDGVPDKDDACVDVPGDIAHQGCPDSDGDGLYDHEDDCPREAGPIENKGCPYKDTDGDGVPDKDDDCPTVFGDKDNRGCPKLKKQELDIIKYAFDNLEFETGKDIIRKSSYISLNGLAKLLVDNPTYGLKIEGHTDSDGNDNSNLILSQKRADAVKRYLIGRGVDGAKLETEGFGETRPIADNSTKEGKQKNRRVEMKIIFK